MAEDEDVQIGYAEAERENILRRYRQEARNLDASRSSHGEGIAPTPVKQQQQEQSDEGPPVPITPDDGDDIDSGSDENVHDVQGAMSTPSHAIGSAFPHPLDPRAAPPSVSTGVKRGKTLSRIGSATKCASRLPPCSFTQSAGAMRAVKSQGASEHDEAEDEPRRQAREGLRNPRGRWRIDTPANAGASLHFSPSKHFQEAVQLE